MNIRASLFRHTLEYLTPARTSRGEMKTHDAFYLVLTDKQGHKGYGEASPLPGLSIDQSDHFASDFVHVCIQFNEGIPLNDLNLEQLPSVRFAFETAILSLRSEDPRIVFPSSFTAGVPLPINGLVWMNSAAAMLEEAEKKVRSGFDCMKFKIGGLDFDEECRMLEAFRKRHSEFRVTIRLDANGSFHPDNALQQLKDLSRFSVHSMEQPIAAGNPGHMEEVCAKSKIPVALDEELIGIPQNEAERLLNTIKPTYLVLKPTLLGGFEASGNWCRLASAKNIGYWATSALESNIGLNAIAQWAATLNVQIPQGLGTGALYSNNVPMPLEAEKGHLCFTPQVPSSSIALPGEPLSN